MSGRFISRAAPCRDRPPRDEQGGHEQPDQPPSAVGHNQHEDSDHEAGQRCHQRRCYASGRRQRPGAGGAGGRDLGCGPGGGEIGQQFPELTPGPRGQRPPGSLVELCSRQPARLEVLAQVRYDRVAVIIGRPHRSRKIMSSHGAHRFSLVRRGCRQRGSAYLYCRRWRVTGTIAGCHQLPVTSVTPRRNGALQLRRAKSSQGRPATVGCTIWPLAVGARVSCSPPTAELHAAGQSRLAVSAKTPASGWCRRW